ncbi:MAG: response regulator [Desulfobacterales bacterium]|nr:response regulator [Desulfobacterales bacterium]
MQLPWEKPLHKLVYEIQGINWDKLDKASINLGGREGDELKLVESSFNDMLVRLKNSQQEFQELNLSLENKVEIRTRDLQETLHKLKESENLFRSMFENHHAVMLLIDPENSKIIAANKGAQKFYGYTSKEFENLTILQINQLSKEAIETEMKNAKTEKRNYFYFPHKLASGEIRDVEVHSSPIRFKGKINLFSIIHDITERRRAEEELKKAKIAAEASTLAKTIFLSNMSHEIRTPMTAIIGSSKLLLDIMNTPEQKKYLNIINTAGNNLLTIINDILDLSKIEAGKIDIDHQYVDLSELLNDVRNILYPLALSKGIEIIYGKPDKNFPVIKTDPVRLKQVLLNLGYNAVKFTYQGTVSINVSIEEETDTFITLCFSVKDTGIGITHDKIDQLFKPFSQISKVKFSGTGLGLVISKKIVELIGGSIHVESYENKGSNFWFIIPFEKGSIIQSIQGTNENIPIDLKILLAEDNIFNQEVIKGFLKNHKLTVVENGKEAVKILQNKSFDVILMDIQMPEMDGLTATKIIRDINSLVINHNIPIIAMTAYAMKEDRDLCLQNGMNGYLSKPIKPQLLNEELRRVLKFKNDLKAEHQNIPAQEVKSILTSKMLNNIDEETLFKLKEYVENLDHVKLTELVENISFQNKELSNVLYNYVSNYKITEILRVLKQL